MASWEDLLVSPLHIPAVLVVNVDSLLRNMRSWVYVCHSHRPERLGLLPDTFSLLHQNVLCPAVGVSELCCQSCMSRKQLCGEMVWSHYLLTKLIRVLTISVILSTRTATSKSSLEKEICQQPFSTAARSHPSRRYTPPPPTQELQRRLVLSFLLA